MIILKMQFIPLLLEGEDVNYLILYFKTLSSSVTNVVKHGASYVSRHVNYRFDFSFAKRS